MSIATSTMTVPVFKGEGRLEYEQRPIPQPASSEVLVRIDACGICGTDLNILATPPAHKATPGIVIGHEGIGVVEAAGAGTELQPGDRVVIAPRLTCGRCPYCRRGLDNQCNDYRTIGTTVDGAFAPYLIAPATAVFSIADHVPLDDVVFFEPLSCVVGSIAKAPFQAGDSVAIIGAGPMGLLFALLYRTLGAGTVIVADIAPYRRSFAEALGVDHVIDPHEVDVKDAVTDLTGLGADLVVDAVGNQLTTATGLVRRGGHILLFGLRPHDTVPLNQYTLTRYDITVHGTFVGLRPFVQTVKLLESGRIRPSRLITHRLPLSELPRGVDLMRSGGAMKVIIETQL